MKKVCFDFDEEKIISGINTEIPLFPLDNVVLFPSTILPLHIFEERYKQMVKDCVNSHNLICMTLLNSETEKNDSNALSNIGCIGRIISDEEVEDGKHNIILYGLRRIRIKEVIYSKPYRQAKIDIVKTFPSENPEAYFKKIIELVNNWNLLLDEVSENYKIELDPEASLSKVTDSLSSLVVARASERQTLLEEINDSRRAEKIIEILKSRIDLLSGIIEVPDKNSVLIN